MNRRDFLVQATVAGAVGLPVIRTMMGSHAALAQPATVRMMLDIERFEKRVDLIRQSLDIPGMSVAVLRKQEVILARGFGIADIAKGIPASEHTPYPIASLTKTFAGHCPRSHAAETMGSAAASIATPPRSARASRTASIRRCRFTSRPAIPTAA